MLLNNVSADTDEERRKIYVEITRAKSKLYIHYNNNIFDGFEIPYIQKFTDENIYPMPAEITVQLTHRDVYLEFFNGKKGLILNLRSGMRLTPTANGMSIKTPKGGVEILRYSKGFSEKIKNLSQRGYVPVMGKIRFIVAWKNKDNGEEYAVILPDIYFGRK